MESSQEITDTCNLSLQNAIKSKDYSYLRKYLEERQHIYTREDGGFTPLQIALQADDTIMVKFLLEHKVDPNQRFLQGHWESCSPLHFALTLRSSAMTMLLIKYGADVFTKSSAMIPAIFMTIKCNRVRVFHHLMENGTSPDTLINKELSLLTYAVIVGNIKIIRYILEQKPNVNLQQNQQALEEAIYRRGNHSKRVVRMLYKYGFTLQTTAINPDLIKAAIAHDHCEAVRNFLQLGVNPNFTIVVDSKTKETENILHFAVKTEQLEMTQLLLEHGADIHIRNSHGKTPILIAAESNNYSIIKLLLKYKANVTDVDSDGCTVLHLAIMECTECAYKNLNFHMNRVKTKIVRLFISKGADVNAKKYKTHNSPLDFAAWIGIPGAVEALLDHGARVDEINGADMTSFKYAQKEMMYWINGINAISHRVSFGKLKFSTLKLLEHHVHRLQRIGLPICPIDLQNDSDNRYELNNTESKSINNEIQYIKETRISNSYVTLCSFLTSTDKKAARLVRNKDFCRSLKVMLHHPNKFPNYAKLIRNKLTAALTLKKLDEVTFKLINFFVKERKLPILPDESIETIIGYLSNQDKEILINQFIGTTSIN